MGLLACKNSNLDSPTLSCFPAPAAMVITYTSQNYSRTPLEAHKRLTFIFFASLCLLFRWNTNSLWFDLSYVKWVTRFLMMSAGQSKPHLSQTDGWESVYQAVGGHKALKQSAGELDSKGIGVLSVSLCGKSDHTVNIQRAGSVVKKPLNRGWQSASYKQRLLPK